MYLQITATVARLRFLIDILNVRNELSGEKGGGGDSASTTVIFEISHHPTLLYFNSLALTLNKIVSREYSQGSVRFQIASRYR